MASVAPAYVVQPAVSVRPRLDSIDLLRGIVMVVMVIDHTRDFVHGPALHYDPTDLAHTSLAIFMTRVDHAFLRAGLRFSRGRQRLPADHARQRRRASSRRFSSRAASG